MKKTSTIIIIILVVLVIWGFTSYNGLISSRENYTSQWSQVESQYQRRFDLIPNLVNAVKGAMAQETEVFTAIAEARTRYSGATTPEAKVGAANQVESAFARLLVIMENYPQLKSIDAVRDLMVDIAGTENRISVERMKYNDAVRAYNLRVQRFPGAIFANIFNFDVQPYFESAEGTAAAPEVKF